MVRLELELLWPLVWQGALVLSSFAWGLGIGRWWPRPAAVATEASGGGGAAALRGGGEVREQAK
eukprot:11947427-Alexandrium_andersonii.AAC.1